jgi:hypothetical protein
VPRIDTVLAELAERSVAPPEVCSESIEAVACDPSALWAARSSDCDRRNLLRSLIADVTLTSEPGVVEVGILAAPRSSGSVLNASDQYRHGTARGALPQRVARVNP